MDTPQFACRAQRRVVVPATGARRGGVPHGAVQRLVPKAVAQIEVRLDPQDVPQLRHVGLLGKIPETAPEEHAPAQPPTADADSKRGVDARHVAEVRHRCQAKRAQRALGPGPLNGIFTMRLLATPSWQHPRRRQPEPDSVVEKLGACKVAPSGDDLEAQLEASACPLGPHVRCMLEEAQLVLRAVLHEELRPSRRARHQLRLHEAEARRLREARLEDVGVPQRQRQRHGASVRAARHSDAGVVHGVAPADLVNGILQEVHVLPATDSDQVPRVVPGLGDEDQDVPLRGSTAVPVGLDHAAEVPALGCGSTLLASAVQHQHQWKRVAGRGDLATPVGAEKVRSLAGALNEGLAPLRPRQPSPPMQLPRKLQSQLC
mmetsp:Transcript_56116/g.175916  ORF Transcript_56116/g.175916 Transcript_56116/m.175916 type:complete len:375 (+) Transcript_56116:2062-3186(+)